MTVYYNEDIMTGVSLSLLSNYEYISRVVVLFLTEWTVWQLNNGNRCRQIPLSQISLYFIV